MTVGQLRKLIEGMPDGAKVLAPTRDHSYAEPRASRGTALYDRKAGWTEDHGEESTPEAEYGKRLDVLIVGG